VGGNCFFVNLVKHQLFPDFLKLIEDDKTNEGQGKRKCEKHDFAIVDPEEAVILDPAVPF
jgi:hypothetical protein